MRHSGSRDDSTVFTLNVFTDRVGVSLLRLLVRLLVAFGRSLVGGRERGRRGAGGNALLLKRSTGGEAVATAAAAPIAAVAADHRRLKRSKRGGTR